MRDRALGEQIVTEVTRRALEECPGLEVRGVVGPELELDYEPIHAAIKHLHHEFEGVRSRLSSAAARFQRLPIVAECGTSGLPAARSEISETSSSQSKVVLRSAQSQAKRQAHGGWQQRLKSLLAANHCTAKLPYSTTDLEFDKLGCDWFAIVHVDGNGLGQVFRNFDRHVKCDSQDPAVRNRCFINQLRRFSLALEECTEKAFCQSLEAFQPKKDDVLPVVPLVLGGDDLTVVCDGRQALHFTKKFIDCFETETKTHPAITRIMPSGVTSCAGIAIVKPHFPFSTGYELAEELLKSAKRLGKKDAKEMRSAIDFHILYDASGADLKRIRRELTLEDGQTCLVARPYLVVSDSSLPERSWEDLARRLVAVQAQDVEERPRLPNSMLHELREGLFLGRKQAEARLQLVRNRYRPHIDALLSGEHLFWKEEAEEDQTIYRTGLLDAVDVAKFW